METIQDVKDLLAVYQKEFPQEDLSAVKEFVDKCQHSEFLYDRKQSTDHITASTFIVDPSQRKMVMIKHPTLNRILQPGGHIEGNDTSILNAAIREAEEETGIHRKLLVNKAIHLSSLPIDIDTHAIPRNLKKNEPAHYHHDFRYLFFYTGSSTKNGGTAHEPIMRWMDFSEVSKDPTFKQVMEKISDVVED